MKSNWCSIKSGKGQEWASLGFCKNEEQSIRQTTVFEKNIKLRHILIIRKINIDSIFNTLPTSNWNYIKIITCPFP